MDDCIASSTVKQKRYGTSKTVWEDVNEHELEEEVSDNKADVDASPCHVQDKRTGPSLRFYKFDMFSYLQ